MKELYLLTCLSEECAEVIQACAKAQRFGPDDFWPEQGMTNAQAIMVELTDVLAVAEMLRDLGTLGDQPDFQERLDKKKAKVQECLDQAIEKSKVL